MKPRFRSASRSTGWVAIHSSDGLKGSTTSFGAGVEELRIDFGPGHTVYFGRDGERLVILLGGGAKGRQQADIAAAHALWLEYKGRSRGHNGTDEEL